MTPFLAEAEVRARLVANVQAALIAGVTQQALAADLGISPQYLSDMLHGHRAITNTAVLDMLGVARMVVYVRKPEAQP